MTMKYLAIISCGICAMLLIAGMANAEWDKGVACFKSKDYPCAVKEFKEVIELNPNHFAGYYMLGLTYVDMRKFPDAEKNFQKAIEYNAKDFGSNYQLALIMMSKKRANDVVRFIDQGLPSATKNQEKGLALRLRGAANLQLKQFDKASQDLTEALKLLPSDELTQFEYGLLSLQQKKYADAFEYLNKTYAKKAMSEEHGLLLVKAAVGSNNFSRAKEVGEALLQKGGNNQELLSQMAVVYLALKEYPQVAKVCNQLPESDPNKYFNLAQAYTTMEDWKNAENALKAWQKKNPADGRAFRMLGYVYMKINDPFSAVPQYDKAYSLTKDSKDLEMKKVAQAQLDKMVKGELDQNRKKALEDDKGKPEDKKPLEKKQDTSTSTPKK